MDLVNLIEGMALRRPPPKIAQVHREAVRIAEERGWPAPSYPVVYRIIAGLDRGLVSLAHRGDAGYRNDFELVLRRESANANDLWQADHTQLDVMVLDESDRPVRPWLTVILDDKSRAVAGYTVFLGDPTALQTALALRQAIWRKADPAWPVCGLPAALYSDHGADFTSDHIAQVCADLKVQLIHSTPGVPRGRGKIERFFARHHHRTAAQAARAHPTAQLRSTRHDSDDGPVRPGRRDRAMADPSISPPHPSRDEADAAATVARRRLAASDAGDVGGVEPAVADVATPRKVHRDGIGCHGLRYLALTLTAYVGEEVTVRYDPRDLAEIRVFHRNQFLCVAVSPELAASSISLKDLQTARNHRRRELHSELTNRHSLVDALKHPIREAVPTGAASLPRPDAPPADDPPPRKSRLKLYAADDE